MADEQAESTSTGSRFRRNFIRVARANVLALAIPFAATPLLTRLYSPADFGFVGIFTSFLALGTAFCTWRFDWAMPNARTSGTTASLMVLGAVVLVTLCVILTLALAIFGPSLFAWSPAGPLGPLLWFLPIALLAAGIRLLFSGWFVRRGDLTAVSRATIAQSLGNTGASIGGGIAGWGAAGLIGATVLATWLAIATLTHAAGRNLVRGLRSVTAESLRLALAKHGRAATISTLVAILNAVSLTAPLLLLAHYYSALEAGWYTLMMRLVQTPSNALSTALGESFWSRAAELSRERRIPELATLYQKTTVRLAIACIPVVLVCLAGPFFIGPLLGNAEWSGAGYVLLAMLPMFLGNIIFSPTNHLVVLNMVGTQSIVDGVRLLLVVGSITLANQLGLGFTTAVALSSLSSFIGHAILYVIHTREHRKHG